MHPTVVRIFVPFPHRLVKTVGPHYWFLVFILLICVMFILCIICHQKLEREAYQLCELLTTGKFLNSDENPTRVLIEMRKVIY